MESAGNFLSILYPEGRQRSSCGYCNPPRVRSHDSENPRTSYSTGSTSIQLTCDVYQRMIDRGWRRSGEYIYKPDLRRSCCPQYTIRLAATDFHPSKSQRKVINRWVRFIQNGSNHHNKDFDMSSSVERTGPTRLGSSEEFELIVAIHAPESERPSTEMKHNFVVALERSSYTNEKYELYEKYQQKIHHDYRCSRAGFTHFLVDSPLNPDNLIEYSREPPAHLPRHYGSFHQMYRIDGELVAMAVLDILPNCVSSVYFMYDPLYEKYSLGKLSALREISLVQELYRYGCNSLKYFYMGFYIHSCQKMRYKGEFSPSYLLDTESYDWYPLKECIKALEGNHYACFSNPEHSLQDGADISTYVDPDIPDSHLQDVKLIEAATSEHIICPIQQSIYWQSRLHRSAILALLDGLGIDISKDVFLSF